MNDDEIKNEVYYMAYGRITGCVERFQDCLTDLLYHVKVVNDQEIVTSLCDILKALESIQAKSMKISRFEGRVVDTPDGLYRLPRDKDIPEPFSAHFANVTTTKGTHEPENDSGWKDEHAGGGCYFHDDFDGN